MSTTNYPTAHLMEYLPVRYAASISQEQDRKEVFNFKDGMCSDRVKRLLCDKIQSIVGQNEQNWIVAFIPASTSAKSNIRYGYLARHIESMTGVKASVEAIENKRDVEAKHLTNVIVKPSEKFSFNRSLISGKNVILIDDVTTTGRSFRECADIVKSNGASSVFGLFVAKTINPDWHGHTSGYCPEDFCDPADLDDYYEPDPADFDCPDDFDPSDLL